MLSLFFSSIIYGQDAVITCKGMVSDTPGKSLAGISITKSQGKILALTIADNQHKKQSKVMG